MNDVVNTEVEESTETVVVNVSHRQSVDDGICTIKRGERVGDEGDYTYADIGIVALEGIDPGTLATMARLWMGPALLRVAKDAENAQDSMDELLGQWQEGIVKAPSEKQEPLADRQRWEAMVAVMQEGGVADATGEMARATWEAHEDTDKRKSSGNGRKGNSLQQNKMLDYPAFVTAIDAIRLRDREASANKRAAKLARTAAPAENPFFS